MKTARYLPLLLCLSIGQALADTPINLQHAATPNAQISISNVSGEVRVTAWDRNQVQVGGNLGDGAKPLAITGSDDNLSIKVEAQGSNGLFNWGNNSRMGSSNLDIHVPAGASLQIDVVSAPLSIDGTNGGKLKLNSISGRIRINAQTPSLDVESVSGGIAFAGHAGRAALQTVSGDILAPSLGNDVDLQTVSGRIQAGGGPWQRLKLSTVSGDVQLNGNLATGGKLDIDSMSGDVQLQLPSTLSSTIHASSFSGDLRSDFGTPKESDNGPGSSLDAVTGGGNSKITIETFSGDLRIRKQD
ncbi:MAG: DUF4097 family beta strand repeat-containing protein [Rhodanobacter sp.]